MKKLARIALLIITALALCGCGQVRYMPVNTVRIDTVQTIKIKTDSLYQKDSVYLEHKGDTVYKYKYKYIVRYVQHTDTFWHTRLDTARVPYPVEAELTKWQKAKIDMGGYLIAFIIIAGAILFLRLRKKK